MGKLRQFSDKISEFTDKYDIANPIEVADEAMGGQTREESKERRAKMKEKMVPETPQPVKKAKGGVAKTVTKEMEYDYKSGKKSFSGTTAQRDRHAEKEGKRVAKDLAYDKSKGMKAGGFVKSADGCAVRGKTKGRMV